MTDDRFLPLTGVHNFRDYGGYAIAGGERLRRGLLFRSAQHSNATPEDLERIAQLSLATVIDLRGNKERAVHPCRRHESFSADVIFHDGETAEMPPHLQAQLAVIDEPGMKKATAEVYRRLPARAPLIGMFRRYFEALAAHDRASLVHCLAGKDRTGIAVALFHHAVGVHYDDIMEDYLLTNTVGDQDARIAASAAAVRKRYGDVSDEILRLIMGVSPEYLDNAFAAIAEQHGSIDAFIETELGFDAARCDALRERYLEVA